MRIQILIATVLIFPFSAFGQLHNFKVKVGDSFTLKKDQTLPRSVGPAHFLITAVRVQNAPALKNQKNPMPVGFEVDFKVHPGKIAHATKESSPLVVGKKLHPSHNKAIYQLVYDRTNHKIVAQPAKYHKVKVYDVFHAGKTQIQAPHLKKIPRLPPGYEWRQAALKKSIPMLPNSKTYTLVKVDPQRADQFTVNRSETVLAPAKWGRKKLLHKLQANGKGPINAQ